MDKVSLRGSGFIVLSRFFISCVSARVCIVMQPLGRVSFGLIKSSLKDDWTFADKIVNRKAKEPAINLTLFTLTVYNILSSGLGIIFLIGGCKIIEPQFPRTKTDVVI